MTTLPDKIFSVNESNFEETALEVFRFQYEQVSVYHKFCTALRKSPASAKNIAEIPFLPVEFFKSHVVIQSGKTAEVVFESSGTTGTIPSRHHVADTSLYEKSFLSGFKYFYGEPKEYVILALLPSYLERSNSSLVYMADRLIQESGKKESGFFLNELDKLFSLLNELKERNQRTILIGVTFGLIDFAEQFNIDFPELIVMETGGMKGRREELTRVEVHQKLCNAFGVNHIHSEYGMTELLSQAYSKGEGKFQTPPWMKILIRDVYDPLLLQETNKAGAVNIIDLANVYSCSFLATGDLGKVNADGSFEILGRVAQAEVRGCNLMVV